jgi:hypothetical protein
MMSMSRILTRSRRAIGPVVALALACAALSGCVYYPNRYAYNGYSGGYYAAAPAVVVAPPPVVVGGWWGGGWGWHGGWGGGWHGGWGGRGCWH